MRVLLDECLPKRLKRLLVDHDVLTVPEAGFAGLKNGRLLRAVAVSAFDVLITIDKNIEYQQNLSECRIGFIVLYAQSNRYEHVAPLAPEILRVLPSVGPGVLCRVPSATAQPLGKRRR